MAQSDDREQLRMTSNKPWVWSNGQRLVPLTFSQPWRKAWSTNPLERLNKEIKRRTNVAEIFPMDFISSTLDIRQRHLPAITETAY